MRTKTMLLISLLFTFIYIGYLKMGPLNVFDLTNLWAQIKPLILHFVALTGCFIFNVLAYRKFQPKWVILTVVFALIASVTYFPTSLAMLIVVVLGIQAYVKAKYV